MPIRSLGSCDWELVTDDELFGAYRTETNQKHKWSEGEKNMHIDVSEKGRGN